MVDVFRMRLCWLRAGVQAGSLVTAEAARSVRASFFVVSGMYVPDERDRDLLKYLHRAGGADIQTLCAVLDITRTAVRARVDRLCREAFLRMETRSSGRGRPRQVYFVTAEGLHALGEDYRSLAVVLWEVISEIADERLRNSLLAGIRDRLARRFQRSSEEDQTIREQVDGLADRMRSCGFNIETDFSADLPILRETNCPFPMLAEIDDAICDVEKGVLEQVLGTEITVRHRCRDGHHCCEFEVGGVSG